MTRFDLVRAGLRRARLRSALLIVSIAVAFLIFGTLAGVARMLNPEAGIESSNELMVRNKINILQSLPVSYRDTIARTEGVAAVSHVNILGGYFREETDQVSTVMVDAPSYLDISKDSLVVSDADRQRFLGQRNGILIDRHTVAEHGWQVGDEITLVSKIYSNREGTSDWRFILAGVFSGKEGEEDRGGIGHFEYLNANAAAEQNRVHWFIIRTGDAARNDKIATALDSKFLNSSAQTITEPAAAMARAFLAQLGDISLIIQLVVGASFATILMIVGNTIGLSVRQRAKEFGVLRAIGFTPVSVSVTVLAESLFLFGVGGLIGLGLSGMALGLLQAALLNQPPQLWALPLPTFLLGLVLIAGLGIVTGALPSLRAMRMSPAQAFAKD